MELEISYNVQDYYDFFEEIDLGPEFVPNIYRFCHTPPLPAHLRFWQLYICKRDEEPVGICGLYENKSDSFDKIWLSWFGVRNKYKRQGIGTFMLSQLLGKCSNKEYIFLVTNRDNFAAIALYSKHGFSYYSDDEDNDKKIIMRKVYDR